TWAQRLDQLLRDALGLGRGAVGLGDHEEAALGRQSGGKRRAAVTQRALVDVLERRRLDARTVDGLDRRPARPRGPITGGGLLAGARVRREDESVLAREPAQLPRRDAALDRDTPEERVERAHPAHPLEREHHTAEGHGAAGEAGPASARDDRDVVLVAPREHA